MASTEPLSTALDQLSAAIAKAESAAGTRGDLKQPDDKAAQLEVALAALRKEHMGLKNISGDVARRLDGAIALVEAILSGRP
ncbi:MAG: hypothetical protein VW620_06970 [Rhodospirillales bacterium]|jgi:hypothetical protein